MTLEFPEIRVYTPKNHVGNEFSPRCLIFIQEVQNRSLITLRNPWGVQSHILTPYKHFKQLFWRRNLDHLKPFLYICLTTWLNKLFHGLQNMAGASSKWAFWSHHCRQSKFIHSLETSPFRIFDLWLHFWKKVQNFKNAPTLVRF